MSKRRRGIYLLPNLFTTSALFCGFYAIVAAINARYEPAAIVMFVAMFLDGMDGRIARMTNTQSDFGEQYDSLSDLVSFGLAPALVMYQWSLYSLGKLGWLAAFVYAATAALRLARFNTQAATEDKRFFQGLPSPAAAALLAGFIWLGVANDLVGGSNLIAITFPLTIAAGLLMVSNIRYHSFKQFDLKGRVPFMTILMLVLILVLIALRPSIVLFLLAFIYAISGPIMTLLLIRRHRAKRQQQDHS
jgi:CDP-diacylglycerol---serine O-phosphatidyltransferase